MVVCRTERRGCGRQPRVTRETRAMTTMYGKPDCPYCGAAVRELQSRGEPFDVVDILADPLGRERLARLTADTMVVPVIVEANGSLRYTFGSG